MRIVSLIPSATEIVAALGLADDLVGVTHSCDYPADLETTRVTSTCVPTSASSAEIDRFVKECVREGQPLYELDTAAIDRLRPDLIVTQSVCEVCAVSEDQALGALEELTVKPEIVSLHPHRLDDVLEDIGRVGEAADVGGRSADLVSALRRRIERVHWRTRRQVPVDVVLLEWLDPPYTCGHWTPDVVNLAGGHELFAAPGAPSRELGWDELLVADPQVLVLASCGQDVSRTEAALAQTPLLGELTAVQEGRAYVADGGAHFSRPGPRIVESLELLAETLHPTGAGMGMALAPATPGRPALPPVATERPAGSRRSPFRERSGRSRTNE